LILVQKSLTRESVDVVVLFCHGRGDVVVFCIAIFDVVEAGMVVVR
jgi:hypothetical protein